MKWRRDRPFFKIGMPLVLVPRGNECSLIVAFRRAAFFAILYLLSSSLETAR